MMDVRKLIEKENRRHGLVLENIGRAQRFLTSVSFVTEDTIFCKPMLFDQNMNLLRTFREQYGKSSLKDYYMSCGNLCAAYSFQDFDLALYCTDVDHALKKLSGGKCKIKSQDTTELKVVCDVN